MHSDGTYVGRSAPEIDIFEAQVCSFVATTYNHMADYIPRSDYR